MSYDANIYRTPAFTIVAAKRVWSCGDRFGRGAGCVVCGVWCGAWYSVRRRGEPKVAGAAGCRGLGEVLGGWTGASGASGAAVGAEEGVEQAPQTAGPPKQLQLGGAPS